MASASDDVPRKAASLERQRRNQLLAISAAVVLRVGLIVYGEYQDAHSALKYTDIDYRVFSDASRYVLHPELSANNGAQGWLPTTMGWSSLIGELSAKPDVFLLII